MNNVVKFTASRALRLGYIGADWSFGSDMEENLVFRIFKQACGKKIDVVKNVRNADIVIVYPYVVGNPSFRMKWVLAIFAQKLFSKNNSTSLLRWMLGVGKKPILFISHENLDRPFWWNMLGRFLIYSDIPRLTFWPDKIDPRGCRFPYWYNYLEWEQYPRKNHYLRFGRFYKIEELTQPIKFDSTRQDATVLISSHLDYPRAALLAEQKRQRKLDIYGNVGRSFKGAKLNIMQKYRYAFCAENSVGFGYDTEKLPEAWVAGCVPVGIYLNPFSDFNPEILNMDPDDPQTFADIPLLKTKPTLSDIEAYVKKEFF